VSLPEADGETGPAADTLAVRTGWVSAPKRGHKQVTDRKPWRRSFWRGRTGIALDVVLVLAVVAAGYGALGPRIHHAPAASGDGAPATPTAPSLSVTAAGLDTVDYQRGHCYTWDQNSSRARTSAADQGGGDQGVDPGPNVRDVPCAAAHLFEAVSEIKLDEAEYPFGDYPAASHWDALTATDCAAAAAPYLGYPLDPAGAFLAAGIRPSPEDWDDGDGTLVCGLRRRPLAADPPAGELASFSGPVGGVDQSLVYPAGSCLAETPAGSGGTQIRGTVACTSPHQGIAVGTITLPGGLGEVAPTDAQFEDLAAPRCLLLAKSFLGAAFHETPLAETGWQRIWAASWKAGSRSFTCTVDYRTAAGAARSVTGPPTLAADPAGQAAIAAAWAGFSDPGGTTARPPANPQGATAPVAPNRWAT